MIENTKIGYIVGALILLLIFQFVINYVWQEKEKPAVECKCPEPIECPECEEPEGCSLGCCIELYKKLKADF